MLLVAAGLASGMVLGFFARWGRFCTLGAIEDWVLAGNSARIRMWLLAVAIAIFISFTLDYANAIDIASISYVRTPVPLVANLMGGFIFGVGMALVGTCGFGMLTRLGGGDLKSVFTFFALAIGAGASMWGVLNPLLKLISKGPTQSEEIASFAYLAQQAVGAASYSWAAMFGIALIIFALWSPQIWARKRAIITAIAFGAVIPFGWWATTNLGSEFDPVPVEAYTFVAPVAKALLFLLATSASGMNFAIATVFGVIIGAYFGAKSVNQFRWEVPDSPREVRRQAIGGLLMGFGGVLGYGCTIGQGFSAASLLAYSAPITVLGIFIGAWLGLLTLVRDDISINWAFWRR